MLDCVLNMPLSCQSMFENIFSLMRKFLVRIEIIAKLKNVERVEVVKNSKTIRWQSQGSNQGENVDLDVFKSMTGYLNAGHHGWVVKKILNSRCSKMVILAFLKPFGKPLKSQFFSASRYF